MRTVDTPLGPAQVEVAAARRPSATLVLGHGAGGGIDAADLSALAGRLPAAGVTVARVVQPWRVAGRRVAGPPASLDVAWSAVLADLAVTGPLLVGGRSAGARVACRTATACGAVGVVALSFPLHPPGRPDRSRAPELLGAGVPTLVVQGERDPFGGPLDLPPGDERQVVGVPWADHSFRVPRAAPLTQREAYDLVVSSVQRWVTRLLAR